jgi:hypothetical protein
LERGEREGEKRRGRMGVKGVREGKGKREKREREGGEEGRKGRRESTRERKWLFHLQKWEEEKGKGSEKSWRVLKITHSPKSGKGKLGEGKGNLKSGKELKNEYPRVSSQRDFPEIWCPHPPGRSSFLRQRSQKSSPRVGGRFVGGKSPNPRRWTGKSGGSKTCPLP